MERRGMMGKKRVILKSPERREIATVPAEEGDLLVLLPYQILEEMVKRYAVSFGRKEKGVFTVSFKVGERLMKARVIHAWKLTVTGSESKRHQARHSKK
jgi:hypothetical protein